MSIICVFGVSITWGAFDDVKNRDVSEFKQKVKAKIIISEAGEVKPLQV